MTTKDPVLLQRLDAPPERIPSWILWNAKKRQQEVMDNLRADVRAVISEHGRSDTARVLLHLAGYSMPTVERWFSLVGDTLEVDRAMGPYEYERHQQLEEMRGGVEVDPALPAGPGVDASAGLERYLRPRGWRRTGRRGRRR